MMRRELGDMCGLHTGVHRVSNLRRPGAKGRDQVAEEWERPRSGVDRAFYPRADTVTTHRQRWVIQRKALHTLFCSILEMTEL